MGLLKVHPFFVCDKKQCMIAICTCVLTLLSFFSPARSFSISGSSNSSERIRLLIYVPVSRGRPIYEVLALARCSFHTDPTDLPQLAVELLNRDIVIHLFVAESGPQPISESRKQRIAQVVDMVVQKSEWITRGFLEQRVSGANEYSDDTLSTRLLDGFFQSYTLVQRLDVKSCPLQRGWLERWTEPLAHGAVIVSPAQAGSSNRPSCEGMIQKNAMFRIGQQLTRVMLHAQRLNTTRPDKVAICVAATQLYGRTVWLASPL